MLFFFFFFSSRRRHTRFDCDWSTDVCSSDLEPGTRLSCRDGPQRMLLLAFLAGTAAYLAQSIVSIDVPPLAASGWVGLAGLAALADPRIVAARESRPRRVRARVPSPGAPVSAAAVAGRLILVALFPLNA